MLIESITLYNFRQYFEDQTIHFSKSATRNVTVIHGENGSGKTALLNAFSWCFYGIINLPNETNIINEHAISIAKPGETIEGWVEIVFIDNGKTYYAKRKALAKKDSSERVTYLETNITVEYKDEAGLYKSVNNPTVELNRILPEDLRTYFFFDGERIDNLSKDSGSEDVKKAIKNIMGLEILERAINHTEKARIRFRNELKKYSDVQTINLIEELDKLELQKEELKKQEELQQENMKATNREIHEVETRMKQIDGAKQLQDLRDSKTDELNEVQENLQKIRKEITDLLSKKGYLAFTYSAIQRADEIIKENSDSTTISGVSKKFIEQLLKERVCICGEELVEGSSHFEHINNIKNKLAKSQSNYQIIDFASNLKMMKERKENLLREMKQLKDIEIRGIQEEKKLSEEIDEISEKLSGKDSEEIVKLEDKRKKLLEQKSLTDRRIGAIQAELDKINQEIIKKNNEAKKHQSVEQKGKLTQKRMDVCFQLETTMQGILSVREKIVKAQLQQRITSVYSQFLRKGYHVQLADNYELNVVNDNGNLVGMSQGERQITSLSFIGAIVDIAREQYKKEKKAEFDEGGIYPLVMDSPFGALDSDHRERIAKGIHKLADQVIVIVSTSQWKGEVQEQMAGLIGKEYRLSYNDPRQNKEKPYEFTEVIEVTKQNV
ncbi:AAA family ATPase [Anaerobacillus sp. MEB173]|uniref:AAA family ATPase n=1 Tax=Anaerobacillus sp. MEB173 TaxID=3383345 RepID=UPI003F903E7E